ncbi:MAG: ATP-binding protein, partial [Candidatus Pacearchaeota archaeon]
ELNQFSYITSHEMQEPLGNILASLDIIYTHYKNLIAEPIQKYLDFIQISTTRMKEQIRAVLEYSLLGENLRFTDCDLQNLVNEAIQELAKEIQSSNCELEVQNLPIVYCSYNEIKFLIKHLISNAIKFKKKEENPYILISSEEYPTEHVIHIEDNGIGISEDYHKKIFQMFQRLHNRGEYEGIGSGLAFCEKIIHLHNGKIWVSKSSLGGTKFSFTLPKQHKEALNIHYEI